MSKRWKMQLIWGVLFALIMTLLHVASEAKEKGFWPQFAEPRVQIMALVHFFGGTFILGYLQWRSMKTNGN